MAGTPPMKATILAVDDDAAILSLVQLNLELDGYRVITAQNAVDALALARQHQPDVAILDVMMPKVDGFTLLHQLRQEKALSETPVLMLTALGQLEHKSQGFRTGADDYLVKPFDINELLLRVEALLRRAGVFPRSVGVKDILQVGHLTLIPENMEVKLHDKILKLTPTEFDILNALVQKYGHTVPLEDLTKSIWGYEKDENLADTIRVHVRHLRAKLEKAAPGVKYIETVYGAGYRLFPEGDTREAAAKAEG